MQESVDDIEKYKFYLNAKFEFCDSLLFSNLVRKPSFSDLIKMKFRLNKNEIERLYNHFHISAISDDIDKQREYAIEIWKTWRLFFLNEMGDKSITIEIYDSGYEIIIYVYEK